MPKVRSKSIKLEVHHNSKMNQALADDLVSSELAGKDSSLVCKQTARKFRNVELPDEYPDDDVTAKDDVAKFILLAMWKATRRLASSGIDQMGLGVIPVTLGVLVDKFQILNNQPTSMSLQVHTSMNHSDIAKRIQESKASKSQVVDAQVIVDDKKQT